jgi:hypothetical protein
MSSMLRVAKVLVMPNSIHERKKDRRATQSPYRSFNGRQLQLSIADHQRGSIDLLDTCHSLRGLFGLIDGIRISNGAG